MGVPGCDLHREFARSFKVRVSATVLFLSLGALFGSLWIHFVNLLVQWMCTTMLFVVFRFVVWSIHLLKLFRLVYFKLLFLFLKRFLLYLELSQFFSKYFHFVFSSKLSFELYQKFEIYFLIFVIVIH